MHVFVFYFLLIAFSILVYLLFSYSAIRLQECSIKSVSQSVSHTDRHHSSLSIHFSQQKLAYTVVTNIIV